MIVFATDDNFFIQKLSVRPRSEATHHSSCMLVHRGKWNIKNGTNIGLVSNFWHYTISDFIVSDNRPDYEPVPSRDANGDWYRLCTYLYTSTRRSLKSHFIDWLVTKHGKFCLCVRPITVLYDPCRNQIFEQYQLTVHDASVEVEKEER